MWKKRIFAAVRGFQLRPDLKLPTYAEFKDPCLLEAAHSCKPETEDTHPLALVRLLQRLHCMQGVGSVEKFRNGGVMCTCTDMKA